MNLEQAAFVAELIGGLGVIFSLVYLASEVRRSTKQSQRDSMALLTANRNNVSRIGQPRIGIHCLPLFGGSPSSRSPVGSV